MAAATGIGGTRRKSTVEESLVAGHAGVFAAGFNRTRPARLLGPGPAAASLRSASFVTWGDGPTHHACITAGGIAEDVRIPIRLQTTPTQFGGRRWWFTCPLIVNGVACNRRVGKLYLPPGGAVLRLPDVPSADLPKLPRGTSGGTAGRDARSRAGLRPRLGPIAGETGAAAMVK